MQMLRANEWGSWRGLRMLCSGSRFAAVTAVLVALVFGGGVPALAQDGPLGLWVTEGDRSRIDVHDCDGRICGAIVWLAEPLDEDGAEKLDMNNEDESLRGRPLMGLPLIEAFVADGENRWSDGRIYNPEDGETYQATMRLTDANTLEVRGYVLLPLFGKTRTWTRYVP